MSKPTGTVTFLFTDIEGSTKLSQNFPETLPEALDKHHSILTEAVESNNGFVFKIIGDAFCCAFQNTEDAVKAAVDAQIKLNSEEWKDAVIKVRMGIHIGNAEWNGTDYMGYITLARSSRVMSAANGGQILISDKAYEVVNKNKYDTNQEIRIEHGIISFRDLGERRLKDLIQPVKLYQVISDNLLSDFPPLKTLDARPNNLPIQLSSFIGREKEMKIAKNLLKQSPLLTLIGTGGAGKTRLALQTAADLIDDFTNGVWFVDLAAINDKYLLPQVFLTSLGIAEVAAITPEETLKEYLADKNVLIILDNCEHLIHNCAELTEKLLSSCSGLKIIATSREALNCSGEQTYSIPPLTNPDLNSKVSPEQLIQYESVRLFIERALSVNPNFRVNNDNARALAEICSRLDGIPLAIELAAARIKVLSVEKIYERLSDRFNLLTSGKRTSLPRQQTLKAMIDWSYDLLTENEKNLWSRVSAFTGGWTLEAAEEICSDETISKDVIFDLMNQLTEKSIIIYDVTKDRYRILESMKQYGIEKLSDENEIFIKHLNYFLELSIKAEPELKNKKTILWLNKIESDYNNIISAIEWSVNNGNIEKGAVISNTLGRYWNREGLYSTGISLIEIILESSGTLSKLSKGNMLYWIGSCKMSVGDYEQSKKYLEESLEIYKETGDKNGIALSVQCLGTVADSQGDYEPARKYFEECLTIKKEIGDKSGTASSILSLGNVASNQGEFEQAKKYYKESLEIFKEIGSKYGIALSITNLGILALYQGDNEQAKKYLEESLTKLKEIGNKKGMAHSIENLGNVASNQGEYDQAKSYYEESLDIRKEIGDKNGIAESILSLGLIAFNLGCSEQAKNYFEESLDIRKKIGDKYGIAESINKLGSFTFNQGDYEQSKKYYEESLCIFKGIGSKNGIANSLNYLGNVAYGLRDFGQAKKYCEDSLAIYKDIVDKNGIAHSINNLGNAAFGLGDFGKAIKLLSSAEKLLESMGVVLNKNDQKIKDENIAKIREQLSKEEFAKYRDEGENLTLDEAYKLAVKQFGS
ncbi:MAG: tetratricopeptide repeat protein [Ignavibacteria bacterium]|nr:tetratricopeptide repeat protein [Ignavibacteria bacterium]